MLPVSEEGRGRLQSRNDSAQRGRSRTPNRLDQPSAAAATADQPNTGLPRELHEAELKSKFVDLTEYLEPLQEDEDAACFHVTKDWTNETMIDTGSSPAIAIAFNVTPEDLKDRDSLGAVIEQSMVASIARKA